MCLSKTRLKCLSVQLKLGWLRIPISAVHTQTSFYVVLPLHWTDRRERRSSDAHVGMPSANLDG